VSTAMTTERMPSMINPALPRRSVQGMLRARAAHEAQ
jgi:hypothetical protein